MNCCSIRWRKHFRLCCYKKKKKTSRVALSQHSIIDYFPTVCSLTATSTADSCITLVWRYLSHNYQMWPETSSPLYSIYVASSNISCWQSQEKFVWKKKVFENTIFSHSHERVPIILNCHFLDMCLYWKTTCRSARREEVLPVLSCKCCMGCICILGYDWLLYVMM